MGTSPPRPDPNPKTSQHEHEVEIVHMMWWQICKAFNYRASFHGSRTKRKPCKQICTVNLGFYYGLYQTQGWSEVPHLQSDDQSSWLNRLLSHNKTVNATIQVEQLNIFVQLIYGINGSPETNTTLLFLTDKIIWVPIWVPRLYNTCCTFYIHGWSWSPSFTDHRMEWKPIIFFISNEYIYIYTL
jgi:hypothetical protein